MPIAELSQVSLYYELYGAEDAPPLVLLHGATETFRTGWYKQIEAFSAQYRIVGPDLRGHGRSSNPANKLDLRQMADDIRELLHYLGYEKAHVCGFSGGASVALFLAVRHLSCLESLILVSNNFELDKVRTGNAQFWNIERILRDHPKWWESLTKMHQVSPGQLLKWWEEEDVKRPNFKPADLTHITVPTLVMGGDRDPIIPLEQTIKLYHALPNAYLSILPGMGHGAPRYRPHLFNRIVLDFLEYVQKKEAIP